jgi:site-specific DNA-methyltransferase (adenine-specific)
LNRENESEAMTTPWKRHVRIGDCDLYLGDCLEVMPALGKVDAILTDPPYGLGEAKTEKNNYNTFSDAPDEVFSLVSGVIEWGNYERLVMTPGQKMMFRYKEPTSIGAFYYPAGSGSCSWGFVGWQPIFYYGKDPFLQDRKGRAANCFQSTESAEKNGHPCPKPITQWTRLLKRISRPSETILDPFMGSGTTLVACAKLGRKGIGIELDPDYFEIACKRVQQAYDQPDLFVEKPTPPTQEGFEL